MKLWGRISSALSTEFDCWEAVIRFFRLNYKDNEAIKHFSRQMLSFHMTSFSFKTGQVFWYLKCFWTMRDLEGHFES